MIIHLSVRIDGGWSSWSTQVPCSRTCGGGIERRIRTCDNPAPKNGGSKCVGLDFEDNRCNVQRCIGRRLLYFRNLVYMFLQEFDR